MPKNIVVCSDGTGNTAIKGRGTNVFKLYEALDLTSHRTNPNRTPQVAFYDDGVGTEEFKPLRILGGAAGYGLSRNVKQLYTEIVRVYDPGDQIFLFGFSRGAFTARTLGGFIAKLGLLDPRLTPPDQLDAKVKKAYRIYRRCYRPRLAEMIIGKPDDRERGEFKKNWCHAIDPRIRFIGVWDTVDAVGLPFHISDLLNSAVYRFKFPDLKLSSMVDHAYQALAIDEERQSFAPLLWDESNGENRIEQVWFAGAHSNVGGGYPKQGMSLVTLDWMMAAAERHGLRFLPEDQRRYREHANFDDKLYDSRAGLGVFYRWKPRNIAKLCAKGSVHPKVHVSVLERIAHATEGYAPGNLPFDSHVAITPGDSVALLELRALNSEQVLSGAKPEGTERRSFLDEVPGAVATGFVSYYVYLLTVLSTVVAAAGGVNLQTGQRAFFKSLGSFLLKLVSNSSSAALQAAKRLWSDPLLLGILAAGFLLAYILANRADKRMSKVFSRHWSALQPRLREALKGARGGQQTAQVQRPQAPPLPEPPDKSMAAES